MPLAEPIFRHFIHFGKAGAAMSFDKSLDIDIQDRLRLRELHASYPCRYRRGVLGHVGECATQEFDLAPAKADRRGHRFIFMDGTRLWWQHFRAGRRHWRDHARRCAA